MCTTHSLACEAEEGLVPLLKLKGYLEQQLELKRHIGAEKAHRHTHTPLLDQPNPSIASLDGI